MKRLALIFALVAVSLVVIGSVSYAANDIIYGCTLKSTGLLRIVNSPSECKPVETPVELAAPSAIPRFVHGRFHNGQVFGTGFSVDRTEEYKGSIGWAIYTINFTPPTPFDTPPHCVVNNVRDPINGFCTPYTPFGTHDQPTTTDYFKIMCTYEYVVEGNLLWGAYNAEIDFICIE